MKTAFLLVTLLGFSNGLICQSMSDLDKYVIETITQRYMTLAKAEFRIKDPSRNKKALVIEPCETCGCCIIENEEKVKIFFMRSFYTDVMRKSKVGFAGIIAHEVAHYVLGHSYYPDDVDCFQRELAADTVSGYLMMVSGISLMSSLEIISFFGNQEKTETHPNMKKRQDAIIFGWATAYFKKNIKAKYSILTAIEKTSVERSMVKAINAYRRYNISPSLSIAGVVANPMLNFENVIQDIQQTCKVNQCSPNKLQTIQSVWKNDTRQNMRMSLLDLYQLDDLME